MWATYNYAFSPLICVEFNNGIADNDDFNDFIISIKETDTDQAIMDKLLYYLRNENKLNQLKIKGHEWSQKYTQEYYSKRF